jgi:hypothetical protein
MQVMGAILLPAPEGDRKEDAEFQREIETHMQQHSSHVLSALLSHINAKNSHHEAVTENQKQQAKRREQESLSVLRLIARLMELQQQSPEAEWEGYIWE